jgi:hypothetical protein
VDYSQVRRGRPAEVFNHLARVLGELNLHSFNLKIGVCARPESLMQRLAREHPWREMKPLWSTDSCDQARQMAELLHAWDAKLCLQRPDSTDLEAGEPVRRMFAFAVVR